MGQVELLLEKTVKWLLIDVVSEDVQVFVSSQLSILNHVKETAPDKGSGHDICHLEEVQLEEFDRVWVQNQLNE